MNKRLASIGLTAGLLAGGAAGLALGVTGVSSASPSAVDESTTTTDESTGTTDSAGTTDSTDDGTETERPEKGAWLEEALQPLIDDGTLTQAQADAVISTLQEARPERGPGLGHRHGGEGRIGSGAAAEALGMTRDELREALRSGQTIADIASEKGVELQTVVDAMVASAEERLAEKVADGTLTQEEADARLAEITETINDRVNGTEGS